MTQKSQLLNNERFRSALQISDLLGGEKFKDERQHVNSQDTRDWNHISIFQVKSISGP